MPRAARLSNSPLAAVRRYFGLHQFELAAYLGGSPELAKHQEAGRRRLGAATAQRLLPLMHALPAPGAPILPDAAPTAHLAPSDTAPLAARLDYCQHHAARLRRELKALETQLEYARRWQQALPALLAGADERARGCCAGRPRPLPTSTAKPPPATTCCACAPRPSKPRPLRWVSCWWLLKNSRRGMIVK